jgi:sugar phosphate permease
MSGIYYGWIVLVGLFIAYTASNGIVINVLPLFYPDLIQEFGWDQEEVTRPSALFYLFAAFLSPIGGYLVDRFSPQRVMFFGVTLITAALFCFQFVTELWQLTISYIVFALGLSCGGIIASMLLLTRWFVRYRGLAVGILLMASSFGGAVFSLAYIPGDWRTSILLMTVVGGIMMILPIIFLVRNRPQDMGLHPDGAEVELKSKQMEELAAPADSGPTLAEAAKTPIFWLLAFATGTMWFCFVGVLNHQSIYLRDDAGIDAAHLPLIFSTFFWAAVVGKVLFGYLSDLFDKGLIMLLGVINLALGIIVLRLVGPGDIFTAYTFAVVYGVGYSGAFTMIQMMIAEYFSGASYGKILGCFAMVDTLAGAAGIQILGRMRVGMESYIPSFNLMITLCVIATGCIIVMNRLTKRGVRIAAEVT